MYNSKIEEYYFIDRHVEFLTELENFIGYITRKYFPGFRQSSYRYKSVRCDIISALYGFLKEKKFENNMKTHFEKTQEKVRREHNRELDFRSYLYTQIRGELTIFMYHWNIERKTNSSLDVYENDLPYNEQTNYIKMELENIIKKRGVKLEDNLDDLLNYLIYYDRSINFKNIFQIRWVVWIYIMESQNASK